MSPREWQLPIRCPQCQTETGLPFMVQSKTCGEVIVSLRCSRCDHQWIVHRATPLFLPKPDRRDPSGSDDAN